MALSMQQASGLLLRRKKIAFMPRIYHPLTSQLGTLPTGQSASYSASGSFVATEYQGVQCMQFTTDGTNSICTVPYPLIVDKGWNGTISVWVAASKPNTGSSTILRIGSGNFTSASGEWVEIIKNSNGVQARLLTSGNNKTVQTIITDTDLHHVLLTVSRPNGSSITATCGIYIDGTYQTTISRSGWRGFDFSNAWFGMSNSSTGGVVYLSALRIWNRILSSSEIAELAQEFNPTT